MNNTWEDILELAKRQGVVTPNDVRKLGLAPENLNRLANQGQLRHVGRGLFEHPEYKFTENHSYVEVAKAIPHGVICLLSALRIHNVGTQMPWEVWIAIQRGKRVPTLRQSKIRTVTMSSVSYSTGIESLLFEGIEVKVYSLEKTLIDCFRLRRHIGHEVAVEALRESIQDRRIDISNLVHMSGQLRSQRLIQPYLEALI